MDLTAHDDGVGSVLLVEHDQIGVVANRESSLAGEPAAVWRDSTVKAGSAASSARPRANASRSVSSSAPAGADVHVRDATVCVETRQATAGVGADGDAIAGRARGKVAFERFGRADTRLRPPRPETP